MGPDELAMSHGMPTDFIVRDKSNENILREYITTEITVLPRDREANVGTVFGAFTKEEKAMQIREDQQKWFLEKFGEEVVEQYGVLLDQLDYIAVEHEVPRKENSNMSKKDEVVEDAQEVVEEQRLDAITTDEAETTTESTETEEVVTETETETEVEEEEEETTVVPETGMTMTEFTTPKSQQEFVDQLLEGIAPVLKGMSDKLEAIGDLQEKVDSLTEELATLKVSDEKRLAEKIAETPPMSLSGYATEKLFAATGSPEAKLDYNEDRALYNRSKDHEADDVYAGAPTASIGKTIARQRGKARVIPSTAVLFNNGQRLLEEMETD